MKKAVVFVICLMFMGTLAYFGGYYFYRSVNPETESMEQISLQRGIQLSDAEGTAGVQEYYVAKIEQEMLMIYKMPEESIYDSVEMSSLHFQAQDHTKLLEGMIFQNLTEVFEFLENSMS